MEITPSSLTKYVSVDIGLIVAWAGFVVSHEIRMGMSEDVVKEEGLVFFIQVVSRVRVSLILRIGRCLIMY